MMTPPSILSYLKAAPFRPFQLHMASGRTFEVRHPEMVKVGKELNLLLFSSVSETPEVFDEWESVSLMLIESVSHPQTSSVGPSNA